MAQNQLRYELNLTVTSIECCTCGHLIFMSTDFETRRRRDKNYWYCTSCGQGQRWSGESDIDKVKKELDAETKRKMDALAQANELRASLQKVQDDAARLKKRAHAGVCPCCNRTFQNVARHMKTKHGAAPNG
jgi:hypothetical protein